MTETEGNPVMTSEAGPIEPERQIIDPHLHLWEILPVPGSPQAPQRFLFDELRETVETSGHNVTHTVFVECHQMYRRGGAEEMRCIGETEFVNGIAAMSESGNYGRSRIAHRIVGSANLLLGSRVKSVIEEHVTRAGKRFRGIRMALAYSEADMFGHPCDPAHKGIMTRSAFIGGARVLAEMNLSLDVWCLHTQLDELIALADALPDLAIVLDHIGTPESQGIWAGREDEAQADWATRMGELARRSNVVIKLGGLGMDISGQIGLEARMASGEELAARWRPYLETCIEAFGARRCMFESNFPPDQAAGSYGAIWNAFKIIAQDCSEEEKDWLFRRTAAQTYCIELS